MTTPKKRIADTHEVTFECGQVRYFTSCASPIVGECLFDNHCLSDCCLVVEINLAPTRFQQSYEYKKEEIDWTELNKHIAKSPLLKRSYAADRANKFGGRFGNS
jgi:hypothetical protein